MNAIREKGNIGMPTTELVRQMASLHVVAVIPAYNEERFIGSVVLTTLGYASTVIVVDDGSSDRTAEVAKAAGAVVVRLSRQGGKGRALNAGFQLARDFKPDAIVTLDGDAQHDPAEIPVLAAPIVAGLADVVIGSRFLGIQSRIPWWRKMGQKMLTVVTNAASGVHVTDSQTGYRAFSQAALDCLRFHSTGLSVESEMQFLLGQGALRWMEVPVHVQYRDGNKRNPVVHGLSVMDTMLGLVARRHPLLFFGGPGLVLAVMGFIFGINVIEMVGRFRQVPVGTAIMSTLLLIGGLLLGVTGTILHSLEHFAARIGGDIRDILGEAQVRSKEVSSGGRADVGSR